MKDFDSKKYSTNVFNMSKMWINNPRSSQGYTKEIEYSKTYKVSLAGQNRRIHKINPK